MGGKRCVICCVPWVEKGVWYNVYRGWKKVCDIMYAVGGKRCVT